MSDPKTAPADDKGAPTPAPAPAPEPARPAARTSAKDGTVRGARIVTMHHDTGSAPALVYKGDVPRKGSKVTAILDDVTYSGIVADATEADGEVLVEFRDGLTPEDQ